MAAGSLRKKNATRQSRWKVMCATEHEARTEALAERKDREAFVEFYLERCDELAEKAARLDRETARGFMSMVLQFDRECFLVRRRRWG